MNLRTTIIVLIVAVALGIFAIARLRTSPPGGTTPVAEGTRLLDPAAFDPDQVTRITLTRGEERFVFQRNGDEWRQTEPGAFDMSAWSVRMLATSAADVTISETIAVRELTGELAPERLGLAPPAATVAYDIGDNRFTILLGRRFVGGKAYARLAADGPVHVVDDNLHRRVFDHDPREWRLRDVFSGVGPEAARVTIHHPEPGRTIALHKVAGRWRMTLPVNTHAESSAVSRLVTDIGAARLRAFIEDDPDDLMVYGLEDPWAMITVETDRPDGDGGVRMERQTLLLGNPTDLEGNDRYATRADWAPIFTIIGATIDLMTPDPKTLVGRSAINIPAADVRALTIDGPDGRFRLERDLDEWVLTTADEQAWTAESTSVDGLVRLLTTASDGVEITPEATVVGDHLAQLTVEGFAGDAVATITARSRERNGDAQLLLDDGSGAIRYRTVVELPDFSPGAYIGSEREDSPRPVAPLEPPDK